MKIIALTTCHNRKDLTLRALKSLYEQDLPEDCKLEICIVDDGSSDGTGEAVKAAYPEITVLQGTGSLYWAGGMRFGWEKYVKHQEFDYLLVFNDDVLLYPDAVNRLLSAGEIMSSRGNEAHAVAGAFKDTETKKVSYSGVIRNSLWNPLRFDQLPPSESTQECDTLNMNLALISLYAIKLIGFLSAGFTHSLADYDFGLRLREKGGIVSLAPNYIGECGRNLLEGSPKEEGISLTKRWRRLNNLKNSPPKERALFCRRHTGLLWPIFWTWPYFGICAKSIMPLLGWKNKKK